jgi:SOS-response transcriptional repressor LexA
MTEGLARLQEAMAGPAPPKPFVGAGFSSAATSGAAHASWRGLLFDGIKVCERVGAPMPPGWAGRMRDQLDNADAFTYIAAADEITRRLRAVREGREFGTWIRRTVGGLQPSEEGKAIILAVRRLAKASVVVTTNYDTLVEGLKPAWQSSTWTDEDYGAALSRPKTVVHLHGVASEPRSIILSSADYERLTENELTQVLNQALFASHTFVFIGCGDGLRDPDITPLMDFVQRIIPEGKNEHYILVTGGQLRQLNEHPISSRITPVAYGSNFDDLTPFLQKLADRQEIDVSQDPEFYEGRAAARPRTALLDLAGRAWERLQAARDALERAMRTMDQVERRGAAPEGMDAWDYTDQHAVHEQLAASVRGPALQLESYLVQVVSVFKDAESDIGQLTGPRFDRFARELKPMTDAVSELEGLTWELLDKVKQTRDDLRARSDICDAYRVPRDTLSGAHQAIDHANDIARSLKGELVVPPPERDLRLVSVTSGPEPTGAAEPEPPSASDAEPGEPGRGAAEPDVERVPLLWKVAAGKPRLVDEEQVREYLPLPSGRVRGHGLVAFEVEGHSMTGEDGVLEGDHVIVDRRADWDNGDMVVVLIGSDEGSLTVKRFWKDESSIRLESSNPAEDTLVYKGEDKPMVVGKVVAVTRWHIKKGRRRPNPLGDQRTPPPGRA